MIWGHRGPQVSEGSPGGPCAWPPWATRPPWGCVGWDAGTPWALPDFTVVPACAGPAAAPKMASGPCKPRASGAQVVHRVCKSCVPAVQAACTEQRASVVQGACTKPRAPAAPATCAVLASPAHQPREPRASSVRRAVCAHTAPASVQACGSAQPRGSSSLPFPPSKADSLRVALSTERLPCDYPSDNVLIVLLALCQANLNCISILQHLFSAITIWINLKL